MFKQVNVIQRTNRSQSYLAYSDLISHFITHQTIILCCGMTEAEQAGCKLNRLEALLETEKLQQ